MYENNRGLNPIAILTDIEEGKSPTKAFEDLSKRIAGIIIKSEPKYTIGIYGDWGTGKTTLMKSIKKNFSETNEENEIIEWIPTVWFNAWRYENEIEKATIPLILTILERLAEVISNSENQKQKSWFQDKKYRLRKFVKGWSIALSIPIGFANVDLSYEGQNDKDEILNNEISKPNIQEGLDLIKLFSNQIISELGNALKIVVFIDDLDRCSPKKTIEILESIKILLDIEGIVYVVGLNHNKVEQLISTEFQKNNTSGSEYIQKIIQIPIRVPAWEGIDFEQLLGTNIKEIIDEKHFQTLIGKEELLFTAVKGNPRQLKRLINSIILAVEVFGEKKGIDGEVLLIVELMRSIWNDIFERFSTHYEFRIKIKNILESENRLNELNKLRTKQKNQQIEKDDEIILTIQDELWDFFKQTGEHLFNIKDWTVYRSITKLMKEDPTEYDADYWLDEGNTHDELEEYEKAVECYKKGLKFEPKNKIILNNMANALADLGRYNEALENYEKSLNIDSHYKYPMSGMAYTLNGMGRYNEAIKWCDRSINEDPNYIWGILNKSKSLRKLGKYIEALDLCDESLKIDPYFARGHYFKSCVLALMNKPEESLKSLKEAINLNKKIIKKIKNEIDLKNLTENIEFKNLIKNNDE